MTAVIDVQAQPGMGAEAPRLTKAQKLSALTFHTPPSRTAKPCAALSATDASSKTSYVTTARSVATRSTLATLALACACKGSTARCSTAARSVSPPSSAATRSSTVAVGAKKRSHIEAMNTRVPAASSVVGVAVVVELVELVEVGEVVDVGNVVAVGEFEVELAAGDVLAALVAGEVEYRGPHPPTTTANSSAATAPLQPLTTVSARRTGDVGTCLMYSPWCRHSARRNRATRTGRTVPRGRR